MISPSVRTFTAVHIDTNVTSDLSDIQEISIRHLRKAGNRDYDPMAPKGKNLTLSQTMEFPKGRHKCQVIIRTKKGANIQVPLDQN